MLNLIFPSMKWINKTYLRCISLCFGVCLSFYCFFFLLYCITTVTPFIRRSQGWSLRSGRVLDQLQQKLNHLWRTSRHIWLSSSTRDCCCVYQLICIMTISTCTTGARDHFFTVQEPCKSVISALAPSV